MAHSMTWMLISIDYRARIDLWMIVLFSESLTRVVYVDLRALVPIDGGIAIPIRRDRSNTANDDATTRERERRTTDE
jgi:hypothetical protein